jgi:hypothetical protein
MGAAAAGRRDAGMASPTSMQSGSLWSLWNMFNLKIWRILEAHETLIFERGFFERAMLEIDREEINMQR